MLLTPKFPSIIRGGNIQPSGLYTIQTARLVSNGPSSKYTPARPSPIPPTPLPMPDRAALVISSPCCCPPLIRSSPCYCPPLRA